MNIRALTRELSLPLFVSILTVYIQDGPQPASFTPAPKRDLSSGEDASDPASTLLPGHLPTVPA